MKQVAVCNGINKYPDPRNMLRGCITDAMGFTKYFREKKKITDITTLVNEEVTKKRMIQVLLSGIAKCDSGDHFIWTSSSHGTYIPDRSSDEVDGRDEAICLYDGNLLDDDIRAILDTAKPGVNITIISDSCFSGTVTRASVADIDNLIYKKPRFIMPKDATIHKYPVRKRLVRGSISEEQMKEILISGCSDTQFSADACINGVYCGALSYFMLQILNNATIDLTYNQFYKALRSYLPTGEYEQIPQLEGSSLNKERIMFS